MRTKFDVYLQEKDEFSRLVVTTLRLMGLKVLVKGVDYVGQKPDMVAVYPDKKKYYLIEPLSEGCFEAGSPRISARDSMEEFRNYCRKLFPTNVSHACVAACVICDVAYGAESFKFKSVGNLALNSMSKYACLAVPSNKVKETMEVLDYLKIASQDLDILGKFSLVLISNKQTDLLGETKKFVKFILEGRG